MFVAPPAWTPLGYARFGDLSSAVLLATATPTAGTAYSALVDGFGNKAIPNHAVFDVETQNVRVRDDGTSPTSAEGQLIRAGAQKIIADSPDAIRKFRAIETTASASMTVLYYL